MEGTNSRLERILTGLQQTLTQCDSEIGAITSQILVREEALNSFDQADTESVKEQYRKYEENMLALQQKNEIVESRMAASQKEIHTLEAKIENLSKSKSDPEVQNLIDLHQATINHHRDILMVGESELIHDQDQQQEIKRLMEILVKEMKKSPISKIDTSKTAEEIEQLKDSQAELSNARLRIVTLINKLDTNRTITGESKILSECERNKRKLDDAFARTPGSTPGSTPGNKQSKRFRPDTPNKPTPKRVVATRKLTQQLAEQPAEQPAEIPTMQTAYVNPAPSILAPFLPPTAAKLLLLVDGRFDSIEWYPSTVKIPMNDDISNAFGKWEPSYQTPHSHFLLQTYQPVIRGFSPEEYRVIAIDPASLIHGPDTLCVPIATTKNKPEAILLLDLIGDLEETASFDFEAVWRLLSKDS